MASAVKLYEISGAVTAVGIPLPVEIIKNLPVNFMSLALNQRNAVPEKTQSFQIPQDTVRVFLTATGLVNIFNAKMPLSLLVPGSQKTAQGRYKRTEMQWAAGRRSESSAIHCRNGYELNPCFSFFSCCSLQLMQRSAVGRASRRLIPISSPQSVQ